MPDLDQAFAGLTEPKDLTRPFDKLLAQFLSKVNDAVVVRYAITLLDGDDPTKYPTALRHFGGAHADLLLDENLVEKSNLKLWPPVWGARALRYVWAPEQDADATKLVVAHLDDPRWRVAEMCAKVVRKQELGAGADALIPLTSHRLSRVRMQAVRALGKVGEAEHLKVIHHALSDEEKDVRRAAAKAMEQRASRLDLDLNDLMEGRFR